MKAPIFRHRIFNYDHKLLPNAHLAKLEKGVTNIEEARARSGFTIGYPGWGLIYYTLLSHLDRDQEEVIVETGTNWGCTSIVLAQALVDAGCKGKVATVDIDETNVAKARTNLEAAGLIDRVELYCGDSRKVLHDIVGRYAPFRFAFLDASHIFEDIVAEFEILLPHLTDDAVVLFDNTHNRFEPHENQRVNGALKYFMKEHGGNLINFEFVSWSTPGVAMWQRKPKL